MTGSSACACKGWHSRDSRKVSKQKGGGCRSSALRLLRGRVSGVRRGLLGTSRVDAKITSDNEHQLGVSVKTRQRGDEVICWGNMWP